MNKAELTHLSETLTSRSHAWHFDKLDIDSARAIGEAIARIASQRSLPIVVSVHLGPQHVFQSSFNGASADLEDWARRKRNTAIRFNRPSLAVMIDNQLSGSPMEWIDPQVYAIAGGGVPLIVDGTAIGSVAVSGLSDSVHADDDLIYEGLRRAVGE
jgi:uncharacterized protein (UPF0303 family)